jgi:4-diphosphocytidyl-2-C-methyl-D-erythritol kinase
MASKPLLTVRAPAKLNLSLRLLRTGADGYHEIRTVFQSIALHDTLTFTEQPGPFRIDCDDPAVPADDTNLVWRAAETIARVAGGVGAPRDIAIRIRKRIPMQSGLGGGSSDAAAALRGFAALWRVRIPREKLRAMAATLGADVPFFLEGGTALGLDRGDLLYPLPDLPAAWVVLVMPSFGVSTKEAYGWWDESEAARGGQSRPPVRPPRDRPSLPGWTLPETGNDLEPDVVRHHPEIGRIVSALGRAGASYSAMSGSGSAVFGLFAARAQAEQVAQALTGRSRRTLVTRVVNRVKYQALAAS